MITVKRTEDGAALTVTGPDGAVLGRAELTAAGAAQLGALLGGLLQRALLPQRYPRGT